MREFRGGPGRRRAALSRGEGSAEGAPQSRGERSRNGALWSLGEGSTDGGVASAGAVPPAGVADLAALVAAAEQGSLTGRSAYPTDEETRKAVAMAYAMLARRPYSRRELEQKLRGRLDDRVLIEATLQWLESRRLLDDRKLAEDAVKIGAARKGWGRRKVQQWLQGRGIDANTAAEAVGGIDEEGEEAQARALAARQRERGKRPDQVFRFLVSRGFPSGVARQASLAPGED